MNERSTTIDERSAGDPGTASSARGERAGRLVLVHISFLARGRPISCWNFIV